MEKRSFIIGITGPTGSGKSTLSSEAERLGFFVINADKVARECTQKGSPLLERLEAEFSGVVKGGELDRQALARAAFSSSAATQKMNDIMLPFILNRLEEMLSKAQAEGKRLILLDAPTLFEAGADALCDITVCVTSEKAERMQRIMARDGITEAAARLRMDAGKSDEFYLERCDRMLYNNQSEQALIEASRRLLNAELKAWEEKNEG